MGLVGKRKSRESPRSSEGAALDLLMRSVLKLFSNIVFNPKPFTLNPYGQVSLFFFILLESLQGEPGAFTQAASISGRLQITQAIYLSKRLINTGAAKTQHKKLHALACALAH